MVEIFNALAQSLNSLQEKRIWARLLGPALMSLVMWLLLAYFSLGWFVAQLMLLPPLTWLIGWDLMWLANIFAWLGGWLVVFTLAYLTSMMLAAIVIVPLLVNEIGGREYAELARRGEDSIVAATSNSLIAAGGFILGWLCTLPLWLIPGMGLVLPVYWLAWLNRRTFAYDVLAAHATKAEWKVIFAKHRGKLLMLGVLISLVAHIPFFGLLAPSFGALAYVHYGFAALRSERRIVATDTVVIIDGEARRM